jgi:hypothetical protein
MRNLILFSLLLSAIALTNEVKAQNGPFQYYSVTPCRLVDTRNAPSTNGGPIFNSATTRDFTLRGLCGIPSSARAITLNVTVTQATAVSYLTLWPSGQVRPNVSAINFDSTDQALGNGVIVGLSTNAQDLSVYNSFGNVHAIIDVTGYFQ